MYSIPARTVVAYSVVLVLLSQQLYLIKEQANTKCVLNALSY